MSFSEGMQNVIKAGEKYLHGTKHGGRNSSLKSVGKDFRVRLREWKGID